ncbi:hypothetical protein [Maricaulis sp.]|uniref:hypothetical protein n=1 Tax=Maricaulis sp. TaxID=1486257 RepID=UPI00262BF2F5|nr:hypothetical protein [Maricaulis sp.]
MEKYDDIPTLKSLAVFAVVFLGIWAFVSGEIAWLGPLRDFVAGLSFELKGLVLASFIIAVLAAARIMVLITKGFGKETRE